MKKITVPLSTAGIERLQKELTDYRQWQKQKAKELAERCAMLGASVASLEFSRAIYTGVKDATVKVVKKGNGYIVRADGKSVLFIEFGSGIAYGYGHPENGTYGMGPGTYPDGKGHWNDPKGWYIPGGQHTYGNPPAMPMYGRRMRIRLDGKLLSKE